MQHVVGGNALAPWGNPAPVFTPNRFGWRPVGGLAAYKPPRAPARRMGQRGAVAALGAVPLLIGGTLSAAAAWVGFSTGAREKGLLSAAGYVIGSLGALGALGSIVGTLFWIAGVSLIPEERFRTTPPVTPPIEAVDMT